MRTIGSCGQLFLMIEIWRTWNHISKITVILNETGNTDPLEDKALGPLWRFISRGGQLYADRMLCQVRARRWHRTNKPLWTVRPLRLFASRPFQCHPLQARFAPRECGFSWPRLCANLYCFLWWTNAWLRVRSLTLDSPMFVFGFMWSIP